MTTSSPKLLDQPLTSLRFVRARSGRNRALPPKHAAPALNFWAGTDVFLLTIIAILLALSLMMVYSTTFDWSYQEHGYETFFLFRHAQNMAIAVAVMLTFAFIPYRALHRLSFFILLASIASLTAVLLFGDDAFGARRGLIGGRFQPGELAQLSVVIYLAAWLSSKHTRIRSVVYGLLPFSVIVSIVGVLVLLQPDLSTTVVIFVTATAMFFLAGADVRHLTFSAMAISGLGLLALRSFGYAQDRVASYFEGIVDLTQTNYHVQQAITAFLNGGWFGVGLGSGRQKFGYLPAPHTDSIFASIGEELGVIGAGVVIILYAVLVVRGFLIARRSPDAFGGLLAAGMTIWLVSQALLNVAVMIAVLPSTGVPLPLISYGGSSMTALLAGMGIVLSVSRATARQPIERRTKIGANSDLSRGNRRQRLPRPLGS